MALQSPFFITATSSKASTIMVNTVVSDINCSLMAILILAILRMDLRMGMAHFIGSLIASFILGSGRVVFLMVLDFILEKINMKVIF